MDETGNNRLSLIYESLIHKGEECGYDFHSLVWEMKEHGGWNVRKVLTQEAFESGSAYSRWVSKLHSFDSISGRAILQVAEGDAPMGLPEVDYHYSWRSWDIDQNREVEFLQKCDDPFQPYRPGGESG